MLIFLFWEENMAKNQTIIINADVIATLKGMDKVVTGLKSGLSEANTKIDFTKGIGASVSKLVDKFKNEFSKFNQLTESGKLDLGKAQEAFDDWYAEKYHEIRAQHNLNSISAQKWLSSKEIDLEIRCQYTAELKRLKADVDAAERKLAFIRRLLDAWDKQLSVIRQLCKNTEIEITQLRATEALGSN